MSDMTSIDDIIRLLEAAKNTPSVSKKAAAPKKRRGKCLLIKRNMALLSRN